MTHSSAFRGKFILSLGLIIASVAYAVWQNMSGGASTTTTPSSAVTLKLGGQYVDGSYTGDAVDAHYGTVQVKTIIENGKISDVQFLQYPNRRGNSIKINARAMPLLTQETIAAQNVPVDGISGATFTSEAFRKSLASALTKAKI